MEALAYLGTRVLAHRFRALAALVQDLDYQQLHGSSQPSPVSGDPKPSSNLCEHQSCMWYICIYADKHLYT